MTTIYALSNEYAYDLLRPLPIISNRYSLIGMHMMAILLHTIMIAPWQIMLPKPVIKLNKLQQVMAGVRAMAAQWRTAYTWICIYHAIMHMRTYEDCMIQVDKLLPRRQ